MASRQARGRVCSALIMSQKVSTEWRAGLGSEELRILASLASESARIDSLPALVGRLQALLPGVVGCDEFVLALTSPDGRVWALVGEPTETPGDPTWMELGTEPSPLHDCLESGRETFVSRQSDQASGEGLSRFPSALCLPLRGDAAELGAFGVFASRPGAYGRDQLHALRIVATFVELAARRLLAAERLVRLSGEMEQAQAVERASIRAVASDFRAIHSLLDLQLAPVLKAVPAHEARAVETVRESHRLLGDALAVVEDVGRLESGELLASVRPVPVGRFIAERIELHMPQANQAGVRLTGRVEPSTTVGAFDTELLGRALDVLIDNALFHTPPKGQVSVVVRPAKKALVFAVGDTGPRVPEGEKERLFSRHARVDGGPRPARALGALDLFFSRLVARAHRGTLVVEDLPGAGAVFKLTLPQ